MACWENPPFFWRFFSQPRFFKRSLPCRFGYTESGRALPKLLQPRWKPNGCRHQMKLSWVKAGKCTYWHKPPMVLWLLKTLLRMATRLRISAASAVSQRDQMQPVRTFSNAPLPCHFVSPFSVFRPAEKSTSWWNSHATANTVNGSPCWMAGDAERRWSSWPQISPDFSREHQLQKTPQHQLAKGRISASSGRWFPRVAWVGHWRPGPRPCQTLSTLQPSMLRNDWSHTPEPTQSQCPSPKSSWVCHTWNQFHQLLLENGWGAGSCLSKLESSFPL